MSSQAQPKLDPLALKVYNHLQANRPKMAEELRQQGKLEDVSRNLANLARESVADGVGKGLDYQAAWEQARSLCFLPDEEDVPDLPSNSLYPTTTA